MAAASRSGGRPTTKAAKKTPAKTTKTVAKRLAATSAKKAPTTKKPAAKAAKKAPAKSAPKAAPKGATQAPTQGVRRGEAPRRAVGAKQTQPARGSGGAQRPPAPAAKTPSAPAAPAAKTPTLTEPADPATLHLTAAPVLHRILTCHVPIPAITRMEVSGESLFSAARNALQAGIRALEHELEGPAAASRPAAAPDDHPHIHTRPIAVPAGLAAALLVTRLAEECFHGDVHVAGGWLVARGAGHPVALPTPSGAATRQTLLGAMHRLAASERQGKGSRSGRSGAKGKAVKSAAQSSPAAAAVTSGARVSAPLILVPAGPQLRAMREALGVTREQVAQVAGLTPDTVGEIERDRRPTAAARLQVAEVLCGMNPATRLAA